MMRILDHQVSYFRCDSLKEKKIEIVEVIFEGLEDSRYRFQ